MFISLIFLSVEEKKDHATFPTAESVRRFSGSETSARPRRVNGSQNSVVGHRGDESRSQRRRGMLCTEARGGVCVCVSERALANGCALARTEVRCPLPPDGVRSRLGVSLSGEGFECVLSLSLARGGRKRPIGVCE